MVPRILIENILRCFRMGKENSAIPEKLCEDEISLRTECLSK